MEAGRLFGRAADSLSVGRAFGTPVEYAGTVVIPVAWVAGGGGGGRGAGDQATEEGAGIVSGRGGGFGGVTWPLGAYVVKDGTVRWVPAADVTRIVLGTLAFLSVVVKARTGRRASPGRAVNPRRRGTSSRRGASRARGKVRGCSWAPRARSSTR